MIKKMDYPSFGLKRGKNYGKDVTRMEEKLVIGTSMIWMAKF
jgi:hypothetical protein